MIGAGAYGWFVPVAMVLFIPFALYLFATQKTRAALIMTFVLGWLFLPVASYRAPGLPSYTKTAAVVIPAFLGMVLFDISAFRRFRFTLIDLPMIAWLFLPSISVLTNSLGENEAMLRIFDQLVIWFLPYLMGRVYCGTLEGARDLAVGIVLGGLIYVPLCLLEMRFSPQLHTWVYGYHQHVFMQSIREGGWRPTVFMEHGIAVGVWMTTSALVAVWLWRRRAVVRVWRMRIAWAALAIAGVSLFLKSFGSLLLMAGGLVVLGLSRASKIKLLLFVLAALPPLYMTLRAPKIWTAQDLVSITTQIDEDRGDSLKCRIMSEDVLAARALQRPLLGWGGWGRNIVQQKNVEGDFDPLLDGLWIIVIGKFGILGLAAMTAAMLLPAVAMISRAPPRFLFGPEGAAPLVLATIVIIFMIDSLFNAMNNPLIVVAAGAVSGLAVDRFRSEGGIDPVRAGLLRRPPPPPPTAASVARAARAARAAKRTDVRA